MASTVVLALPARWTPFALSSGALVALVLCTFAGGVLDVSAHDRIVFWGQANYVFKESILNAVFGIGHGMFADKVTGVRAAHSAFVMCYSELGLFGYWFWFGLILLGTIGCWRSRDALARSETAEGRWLHRFSGLAIAAVTGFAASSYLLSRAFVYPLFFLTALLNAVPVMARGLLPEDHPPLMQVGRDVFVYGTVASLASFAYIYISIILLNRAWVA